VKRFLRIWAAAGAIALETGIAVAVLPTEEGIMVVAASGTIDGLRIRSQLLQNLSPRLVSATGESMEEDSWTDNLSQEFLSWVAWGELRLTLHPLQGSEE